MNASNVSFSRYVGKFNWADPKEEGASLTVKFTLGETSYIISDVVEPGSRHDYDDGDISEAVEAISKSLERYLFSSDRDKKLEAIKLFWKHEAIIRRAYAASEAKRYQRLAAHNASLSRRCLDEATTPIETIEQSDAA